MKILINSKARASGSAMMITLTTAMVFGIIIGTALNMVSTQNRAVARSQAWNNCIPIAEAGIEEALTQYALYSTNLTANGWTYANNRYFKTRTFADGNRFAVNLANDIPPTITSTGWVTVPFSTNQIRRIIQIKTSQTAIFTKGLVSMTTINLNGNNVKVDSFDSTTNLYSTDGRYDVSKRKANGDVASVQGVLNVLNIGNADIYGTLHTGPGGTASVGSQGSVGDLAWVNAGNNGLQTGHFADDMNVSIDDVQVPFTSGASTPASGTINGTNYTYILTNAPPNTNYYLSSFTGSGSIYVGTNAVLHVGHGDLDMGEVVVNTNNSLSLYHGSANTSLNQEVKLKGNTAINSDGTAAALKYYGLPSVKSITLNGNAGYTGTIYAPQADFTLTGSGSTVYDVVGSAIVRSVSLNGHFNFHYDESLGRRQDTPPVLSSWIEL